MEGLGGSMLRRVAARAIHTPPALPMRLTFHGLQCAAVAGQLCAVVHVVHAALGGPRLLQRARTLELWVHREDEHAWAWGRGVKEGR